MQTIKKQATRSLRVDTAGVDFVVAALLCLILAGCGESGPRLVLEGKRLLEQKQYPQAIEKLRTATELLPTNALAFNYLGLAYHQAGQAGEAERAYQRALTLNRDLTEVRYDLACLWLGQNNKLEQAKAELTTYTLRRPNSPEGWLKLGQVELRTHEIAAAEKSLNEALRLDPQNPEALTAMGLARYQRKRANEAAQFFSKALKAQPAYGPALLNLAIVAQQDLNDPRLALEKYREYISLKQAPENAQALGAIVRQLEQQLGPAPTLAPTNLAAQAPQTNTLKSAAPEASHLSTGQKLQTTNPVRPTIAGKTEQQTNIAKVTPTNSPRPAPVTNVTTPPPTIEVVKLTEEPAIKPAEDPATAASPAQNVQLSPPSSESAPPASTPETKSPKRGFLQRINPINLFTHDGKPAGSSAPLVASTQTQPIEPSPVTGTTSNPVSGESRKFPRYSYRSPQAPLPGDRDLAQRAFSQGVQEQQARHHTEAVQAYRRAGQLDPTYYDAQYNLGLAATENGNLALALSAYESALVIQPDSLDARYNFGLVLKQAGYVLDAVSEFEKILAKYPNDGRTHLALGNLYAQQLQDSAKARQHYLAVLAVAPQSPQAGAIRYWLTDHPK